MFLDPTQSAWQPEVGAPGATTQEARRPVIARGKPLKGPVMVMNQGGLQGQQDFGAGTSQVSTPGGDVVRSPLGTDIEAAALSKMAGSGNFADVNEAFRRVMGQMPRSVSWQKDAFGNLATGNPDTDAQMQERAMARFKPISEMAQQSQDFDLRKVLGIGGLGIQQGRLGVDIGNLGVAQRGQQLAEAKAQNEMSSDTQAAKTLDLLMASGKSPDDARRLMELRGELVGQKLGVPGFRGGGAFPTNQALGPLAPPGFGGPLIGGGGGGGPAAPATGGGGNVPPGAPASPMAGGGSTGLPSGPAVRWDKVFGQQAMDELAKLPEGHKIGEAATLLSRKLGDQGMAEKFPDVLKYLTGKYGQRELDYFMQPTMGRQFARRASNLVSKPSAEEVLASQMRNQAGKPPGPFEKLDAFTDLTRGAIGTLFGR